MSRIRRSRHLTIMQWKSAQICLRLEMAFLVRMALLLGAGGGDMLGIKFRLESRCAS